ncbi:hypothetical protein PPYR_04816 [Photinus pyralis]|uniref:GOLD domain-containing protein n=2 Tax=Photinus pyralis TaxID=7054 RepID=A0A1Y1NKW0_PHOPY|nr:uncharacterized protein LOC116164619 [Photinus pyralis]KAB0802630.1 hypothetical protein PPYR_04816 [Photinus pyralis]
MNPYVSTISQLLVVSALRTLILMVLISGVVHSGPVHHQKTCGDLQPIKPAAFYNSCSKKYLRVNNKDIVADTDTNNTLFTITVNNSHGFLLFDPIANMFVCWKYNKKTSRLVPKRNPKDISLCIFEELPTDGAYTKYVSTKNRSYVMSFKSNGQQRIGKKSNVKKRSKCQPEAFMRVSKQNGSNCSSTYNDFCERMKRIKRHKVREEIRQLCAIDNSVHRKN